MVFCIGSSVGTDISSSETSSFLLNLNNLSKSYFKNYVKIFFLGRFLLHVTLDIEWCSCWRVASLLQNGSCPDFFFISSSKVFNPKGDVARKKGDKSSPQLLRFTLDFLWSSLLRVLLHFFNISSSKRSRDFKLHFLNISFFTTRICISLLHFF